LRRLSRVWRVGSRGRCRRCWSRDVTHVQHVHEHSTAAAVNTFTTTIDCSHYNSTTPSTVTTTTTTTRTTTDCRAMIASRSPVCAVVNCYCCNGGDRRVGPFARQIVLAFCLRRHCLGVLVFPSAGRRGTVGPLFVCLSIISSFITDCELWRKWRSVVCTVYALRTHSGKPRTSGARRSQFAVVPLSPGRSDFPTRYRGHRPMGYVRALIIRSRWPDHRSDNNDDVNNPKNCETPTLSYSGGYHT